ncbi:MAG: 4Fe-4S binding protein [Planctomycetota bacterium]|jgi:NAD-dependent dihydropyrimidine dehydrogenase PreA subunit|nr:4Fe-4S binding protein [Planctomycetota bacterium]
MSYAIGADCVACGACESACPVEAISEGSPYKIDGEKCVDCGACAGQCPQEAIKPA